jgi:phytoene dehydrogenase-like protein
MSKSIAVIGTGAAGLSAAAHLARKGHDVIALEQSPWVGGLLHPFTREGYEFDPGVHYVGRCGPGAQFAEELARLDLDATALFAPMDSDFDVYRFPDFEIAMCAGVDHYRARLKTAFPGDTRGVDRVMDAVEHLSAAQHVGTPGRHALAEYLKAAEAIPLLRWMRATYRDFLEWACEDEKLRMVFAAACGDYGLPPGRASAGYGLAVITHYIAGGYFPRGGSGAFRDALVEAGEVRGAEYRPSAGVETIEVRDGAVSGVVTVDGTLHAVDGVVAAIDPRHVYGSMLGGQWVPDRLRKRVDSMESSISACCLYLGLRKDLRDHGWGAHNVWDYPSWDLDRLYGEVVDGRMPEEFSFFISPNSLKDPTGSLAPEGCSTVEVMTFGPWEAFRQWENVPVEQRGAEYDELVDELRTKLMGALETRYPELVSDVEVCELSTPLAFRHHLNLIDGGLYGPAHSPDQTFTSRFSPKGSVRGLTLAGQGVLGCGVSTAVMSGRVAADILASQLD